MSDIYVENISVQFWKDLNILYLKYNHTKETLTSFERSQNGQHQSYLRYWRAEYPCIAALVKVHNDIMEAIVGGSYVILVQLDLSATFDTVEHEILLHRLVKRLGVTG